MYDYPNELSHVTNESYLPSRVYNIIIGLALLWGFAINAIMCTFFTDIFMEWNFAVTLIGYFIFAFAGVFLIQGSSNPLTSFIGYNLIVLPVGVVLSIGLTDYDIVDIANAFVVTSFVTIFMIVLSCIIPDIFLSMGKSLFVSLTAVVIIELILLLLGISSPTFLDFLVALLFCGYIGYDWAEAQIKPKTLDNAIYSVAELYLDIVNLFIRIIQILGKKK